MSSSPQVQCKYPEYGSDSSSSKNKASTTKVNGAVRAPPSVPFGTTALSPTGEISSGSKHETTKKRQRPGQPMKSNSKFLTDREDTSHVRPDASNYKECSEIASLTDPKSNSESESDSSEPEIEPKASHCILQ